MRPFHALAGVLILCVGLAGWATLGQAQTRPGSKPPVLPDPPIPERPSRVEAPSPEIDMVAVIKFLDIGTRPSALR